MREKSRNINSANSRLLQMLLEASARDILSCHTLLSVSVPGTGKGDKVNAPYGHVLVPPLARLFLNCSSDLLPDHAEKTQAWPGGAVRLSCFTWLGNQLQGLGFAITWASREDTRPVSRGLHRLPSSPQLRQLPKSSRASQSKG